jgi:hypothetical protein
VETTSAQEGTGDEIERKEESGHTFFFTDEDEVLNRFLLYCSSSSSLLF